VIDAPEWLHARPLQSLPSRQQIGDVGVGESNVVDTPREWTRLLAGPGLREGDPMVLLVVGNESQKVILENNLGL